MNINTKEYWNNRFSSNDWKKNNGSKQTEEFGKALISGIPIWLKKDILINCCTICDAGCAEGQLAALVKKEFPNTTVEGFDFAEAAIEEANKLYGDSCTFYCDDITCASKEYDIIITSNVLEHFDSPDDIILTLVKNSKRHFICLVPYKQPELFGEHTSAFDFSSFKACVDNKVMTCCEILDLSKDYPDTWNGEQLLIVYSSTEAIKNTGISAKNVFNKYLEYKSAFEAVQRDAEAWKNNAQNLTNEKNELVNDKMQLMSNTASLLERTQTILADNQTLLSDNKTLLSDNKTLLSDNKTLLSDNKTLLDEKEKLLSQVTALDQSIKTLVADNAACRTENQSLSTMMQNNNVALAQKQELEGKVASATETLQEVFDSRSYRVAKILRSLNGDSDRKKIVVNILRSLLGKRGLFAYLNKFDPLFLVINSLKKDIQPSMDFALQTPDEQAQTSDVAQGKYNIPDVFCDKLNIKKSAKKRVAYFTNQVVDWQDFRPRYGGGEKYCLNICRLLQKFGFEVHIYQPAFEERETEYYGFKVKTVKIGDVYSEFYVSNANEFYDISLEYDHVIYNLPEMSGAKMRKDAIMICHGIWFDHNNYGSHTKFREKTWMQFLRRAFSNPLKIVSVDTNSINVIRSFYPELASKMKFIPNFVDIDSFSPPEKRDNKKLTVLFPRRSQVNRGSRILGDILKRVPHDVDFYWVGEGDAEDTNIILELAKKDKRLHYEKASFTEMPEWYRKADITVIPTIACEGTSLSCIEAIASGSATISTNVGGLTDIIYDEVNGLLTDADAISIANAINRLIEDSELRTRLQKAGREYSYNFSLDKWESKWIAVLEDLKWIPKKQVSSPSTVIVTKNAVHGGVETLIAAEMKYFNADCIVAGGLNNESGTCPFEYTYVDDYKTLLSELMKYDAVIYHWIPDWAVQAIAVSGIFSIEFVHRTDTAECDKNVPCVIASHSQYVLDYIKKENGNTNLAYVPNGTDTDRFKPAKNRNSLKEIGAPTSYTETKGIDILIKAWSKLDKKYKDNYKLVLFGRGTELEKFRKLASDLNVDVTFNEATTTPEVVYDRLHLYVTAARIEGLPISVLEALSCNIPIVASDIEGHTIINETFEKAGYKAPLQLFKSENAEDMKNAIQKTLDNYKITDTHEAIEEIYSARKHCEELDKIIKGHFAQKE